MLPKKDQPRVKQQLINIRPAVVDDVAEIVALVNTHAFQGSVLPRSLQSVYDTVEDWIVAEAEGEILGCVSLLPYSSGLVEVRSLAVRNRYQGLGIGTRLMEALLDEARRRRVPTLFALTRKVPFFGRFGFQVTERDLFPEKVWQDCRLCPLRERCDETAMVLRGLGAGDRGLGVGDQGLGLGDRKQ
jgi:amino-acid N-acetyltransferase